MIHISNLKNIDEIAFLPLRFPHAENLRINAASLPFSSAVI